MVAGVGEEPLDEGEALGDPLEDQRRAVAILQTGGVDFDAQHQAEHVGDQMALAASSSSDTLINRVLAVLRDRCRSAPADGAARPFTIFVIIEQAGLACRHSAPPTSSAEPPKPCVTAW